MGLRRGGEALTAARAGCLRGCCSVSTGILSATRVSRFSCRASQRELLLASHSSGEASSASQLKSSSLTSGPPVENKHQSAGRQTERTVHPPSHRHAPPSDTSLSSKFTGCQLHVCFEQSLKIIHLSCRQTHDNTDTLWAVRGREKGWWRCLRGGGRRCTITAVSGSDHTNQQLLWQQ